MKRSLAHRFVIILIASSLLIGGNIYYRAVNAADHDESYPNIRLFMTVLDRVRNDYVDGAHLSYQELIQQALKGMLGSLDPHSEFMEAEKFEDLKDDTQGEFGGVGLEVSVKDNALTVVAPMDDTPSFKAGIISGDRIIRIDDLTTERLSITDAVKLLRGAPGSEVTLTISRPSTGMVKEFKLVRAKIRVSTIKDIQGRKDFPLNPDGIGYVRITQFGEQTSDDLDAALKKLKDKGFKALILDVRGNPGGLLDQAVRVCEKFLPKGQLVVSTEGRDAKQRAEYRAKGGDKYQVPLVVLVNQGSASASEIVAGCLQDATTLGVCKAIILGEQTFGKGSVQSILPLQGGSALRLTTAKYYTPSHKVIHEHGIVPDIAVAMSEEDESDAIRQRTPGALELLDEKEQQRVKSVRDVQLDRAIDLLKGLALYTHHIPSNAKSRKVADRVASKE